MSAAHTLFCRFDETFISSSPSDITIAFELCGIVSSICKFRIEFLFTFLLVNFTLIALCLFIVTWKKGCLTKAMIVYYSKFHLHKRWCFTSSFVKVEVSVDNILFSTSIASVVTHIIFLESRVLLQIFLLIAIFYFERQFSSGQISFVLTKRRKVILVFILKAFERVLIT